MPDHEYGLLLDRKPPEEIAADLIALAGIDLPEALKIRAEQREIEYYFTIKSNQDHEKRN